MEEVVPVLVGVVAAVVVSWLPRFIGKHFWSTLIAALLGMAWTVFSGEASRHWAYLLVDAAQSVVAMWVLLWVAGRWRIGPVSRDA